jgi:Rrf2 family protein
LRFTAQEEYGLRLMVHLARQEAGASATIHQIARAERLTPAYVGKLLRILRKASLVESRHGPAGGYRLPCPPAEIAVSRVLEALGGRLFKQKYCDRYPGGQSFCVHSSACSIRSLWSGLDLIMERILDRTSLKDLIGTSRPLADWVSDQVPAISEAVAAAGQRAHPVPRKRT